MDKRINEGYYTRSIVIPENSVYYNPKEEPFEIYGLYSPKEEGPFKRLPDEIGINVSENVKHLYTNPSGGRIRFKTDSEFIGVRVKFPYTAARSIMPLHATAGFDVYKDDSVCDEVYCGTIRPPVDCDNQYENVINMGEKRMRNITLYMPLYNDVYSLEILLDGGCRVEKTDLNYMDTLPVVYYGSSITQGASASRCALSYPARISRKYNLDFINLGFASAAKGEQLMVDYIKNLPMSVFVMDYDHNAPTAEHLKATHEPMFLQIREAQPKLPVIFISRPSVDYANKDLIERRSIIYSTYMNAIKKGDKKVYFIDGFSLFGNDHERNCSADGTHPNDSGFEKMADIIGNVVFCALKN